MKEDSEGKKDEAGPGLDLPSVMEVLQYSSTLDSCDGNYFTLFGQVLTKQLQRGTVQSKVASLRWIFHLFTHIPAMMAQYIDDIFPVLLRTLSDHSDEVVILDLEVLAEISSSSAGRGAGQQDTTSPHFTQFMQSLLKLFSADRALLDTKGSFIIRQLCLLLSSEDIYRCLAELLVAEENLRYVSVQCVFSGNQDQTQTECQAVSQSFVRFARTMVETLSTILLTSAELCELRARLKELGSQESCQLFCCLYRTWCHSQVRSFYFKITFSTYVDLPVCNYFSHYRR